ncbi:MAG: 4-hydroxythreonine-4-phosphate dehydrogenase PdxA [Verrucomicrobiota bacterium]
MKIAITCGDPSGVGPELVPAAVKAAGLRDESEVALIGDSDWLDRARDELDGNCEVLDLGRLGGFELGNPSPAGAKLAIEAMEAAAAGCQEGKFDAVATGPISKAKCMEVGFAFPGQTEFFADRWGGEPTMAFVGDHLNVVLATWHIPLSSVEAALTRDCFGLAVKRAKDLGFRLGRKSPRVGVCGLNPHAGENGLMGTQEKQLYNPWLDSWRGEKYELSDCLPADTLFARAMNGEFDVVVALYHDQGLGPLKTVDFDSAVNVTLGLPFARTSPDHGTAFEIAGKGVASARSFARAIKLAEKLNDKC